MHLHILLKMNDFRLIIFERQYYLCITDLADKAFKCTEQDMESYMSNYTGKKLQKIHHEDKTWLSCKSTHFLISWYLDQSYSLNPELASFRHDISKYTKLTPKRIVSRSQRIEIAFRQNYACNTCGLFPIPPDFHVDHITALEDGGEDIADNLQALCVSCHSEKTRLNRLRKTQHFAKQAELAHDKFQHEQQNKQQIFSKYFFKK